MNKFAKTACIVLSLLLFTASLFAADVDVVLGAKKGVNVAGQYGYPAGDRESGSIVGFAGGVYGAVTLGNIFCVEPEILFSVKGRVDQGADIEERLFISYLDFPLLLGFKFDLWKIRLGLYAGPDVAVAIAGTRKVDQKDSIAKIVNINDELMNVDAGAVMGIELGVPIGTSVVTVDIRYNLGFLAVIDQEKSRNSTFTFLLGYGFDMY